MRDLRRRNRRTGRRPRASRAELRGPNSVDSREAPRVTGRTGPGRDSPPQPSRSSRAQQQTPHHGQQQGRRRQALRRTAGVQDQGGCGAPADELRNQVGQRVLPQLEQLRQAGPDRRARPDRSTTGTTGPLPVVTPAATHPTAARATQVRSASRLATRPARRVRVPTTARPATSGTGPSSSSGEALPSSMAHAAAAAGRPVTSHRVTSPARPVAHEVTSVAAGPAPGGGRAHRHRGAGPACPFGAAGPWSPPARAARAAWPASRSGPCAPPRVSRQPGHR